MTRLEMIKAKVKEIKATGTSTTTSPVTVNPAERRKEILSEFRNIGWTYTDGKGYERILTFTERDGSFRRTKEWFDLVNDSVKTLKDELSAEGIELKIPSIERNPQGKFDFPNHMYLNEELADIIKEADEDFKAYCYEMYDVDYFINLAEEYSATFGEKKAETPTNKAADIHAKLAAIRARKA